MRLIGARFLNGDGVPSPREGVASQEKDLMRRSFSFELKHKKYPDRNMSCLSAADVLIRPNGVSWSVR